ncbi:hypothetical protein E4U91_35685 [Streptomyces lasalocidi]|uniref:Uncharacterized protein n=1 Tax=Streptomyces lasalocidi TaxID=324833 RepID=A0A4V6AVE4_STRLS|nr:hypothetical protein E4U91_35685 [Streptomyces lasalocidi]
MIDRVEAAFCSPRRRGWSRHPRRRGGLGVLLPAPAGMVPMSPNGPFGKVPAPRARGDGP